MSELLDSNPVPQNLAEMEVIADLLSSQEVSLHVEKIDQIINALSNGIDAHQSKWLTKLGQFSSWEHIFSALDSFTQTTPGLDAELLAKIQTLQNQVIKCIAQLATRPEASPDAHHNNAFRYTLRLLASHPEYQTIVEPYFESTQNRRGLPRQSKSLPEWVEDQKTLDKIGEVMHSAQSLPELIHLISQIPKKRIIEHQTAYHASKTQTDSIITFILTQIKEAAPQQAESLTELTQKYEKYKYFAEHPDVRLQNPPDLGDFPTQLFINQQIVKELDQINYFKKFDQLKTADCTTWVQLMWLMESKIKPNHVFAFTVRTDQGVEQIVRITGDQVIDTVTEAAEIGNLAHYLPKQADIAFIRPEDQILVGLREKLESFFD